MRRNVLLYLLLYLILLVVGIIVVFPIYWAVASSFKNMSEIFSANPPILVHNPTFENYITLCKETLFPRWFLNSLIIAVSYTLLTLFFCSLCGYGFAKYNFPGKNILFLIVLSSTMIPGWITLIPLFIWFTKIKLINTYWVLIVPGSANAFGIFLMRQYIQTVPSEIIDSARIDGCSEFQIYYKILLPLIKPALGALGIFAFLGSWNNFVGALVFMRTEEMFTVPVGLAGLVGLYNPQYGQLMAGSLLSIIPVLIIFFCLQKQLVAGLTLGAVKG